MHKYKNVKVHLIKHAGIKIQAKDKIIYIDPYQLNNITDKADVLFISHSHFDHLSLEDIEKVRKDSTVCVCSKDSFEALKGLHFKDLFSVEPNEKKEVAGISFDTVSAYNTNKFREKGVVFHPKENKWLGFVFNIDGVEIYFAGDTDHLPEQDLIKCDIALLPVSGKYVMTAEEAAELASKLQPKDVAIPMHFGAIVGSIEDARKFKKMASCKVVVLEPEIKD